jgi:flagellar M-ring protein FliF
VGSAGAPENTEENTQVETSSAVSTKTKRVVNSPLTPKRVKVAVSIPSSYYEKVWIERNPTPAGQEVKKPDANALKEIEAKVTTDVQNAVVALLPSVSATVDPRPLVQVTSFQHLPSLPLPVPSLPDVALAWAGQYWSTLSMIGLTLVGLVMLRSMVRAAPVVVSAGSQFNVLEGDNEAAETAESAGEPEPLNARSRLKRRPPGGPSLREELSELVKEDPDSAVSVLRSWIGNAS